MQYVFVCHCTSIFTKFSGAGAVLIFRAPGIDCKLVVSRIHPSITQQDLEEEFSKFGLLYDLRHYCVESEEKPCTIFV